ncbi:TPA: hypothetical protein ACH3X3_004208 [Trebouxia sp. C0006]
MQDKGICSVSETLVDVLAYLGTDLDAEKHDDPQGYSDVGLVTLPVTTAMLLLLEYMEDCRFLQGNVSKLAYFDEHALEPCMKCFSHIVTGLLDQEALQLADLWKETMISMPRPGGPGIKPILLMLASDRSVHPPLAAELALQWALLVISCTRDTCQKQESERRELQREEAYYGYIYQQANVNRLDPGLKASLDSSMREQHDQRTRLKQISSDVRQRRFLECSTALPHH